MTCMCGDTACWSCGPAQGFDPDREALMEDLTEAFPWVEILMEEPGNEEKLTALIDWVLERGIAEGVRQVEDAAADSAEAAEVEEAERLAADYFSGRAGSDEARRSFLSDVATATADEVWKRLTGPVAEAARESAARRREGGAEPLTLRPVPSGSPRGKGGRRGR